MSQDLKVSTEVRIGQASKGSTIHTVRAGIHRALTAVEIGILIGLLVLFNAFPDKVGFYSSAVEPYLFVPLLTPAWLPYVPWLNLWWGLALILALVKLVYGRWTQALRWADLGVHLLGICVLAGVLLGGAIVGGEPAGTSVGYAASTWVQRNPDLLRFGFKAGLVLMLVALVVGFFRKLAKLGITIPVLQWRFDGSRR